MEGERDWRRDWESVGDVGQKQEEEDEMVSSAAVVEEVETIPSQRQDLNVEDASTQSSDVPQHYHVSISASPSDHLPESYLHDLNKLNPSQQWIPTILTVYARKLHLPQTSPDSGVALLPFPTICAANLGPADYISICSSFHTLAIPSIPVLTTLQKNEARRFITLLDACYEARCRLLISADAPPDRLFFPETRTKRGTINQTLNTSSDSIDSEAFSEMYQDSTAPFRPNVSTYTTEIDTSAAPTTSIHNPSLRSVLADEDADFGPTYGNGRSQHGQSTTTSSDGIDDEIHYRRAPNGFEELDKRQGPDFTQTGALTGADERFAYKRARSRLWEMCGHRWWSQREGRDPSDWWMPAGGRFWEKTTSAVVDDEVLREVRRRSSSSSSTSVGAGVHTAGKNSEMGDNDDNHMFRHGASPFRTASEPPPKFGWQHAWGMVRWGRKAGEWGKGVESERIKEKEKEVRRK